MQATDIDMVHVPYKGSAPAVLGIVAGEVQLMFGAVSTTLPHVNEGALKALAVSTAERIAVAPEIPTVAESGLPGFAAASWYGILAPAGTPPEVVKKLNDGIVQVLKAEPVNSQLEELGFNVVANSPEEFKKNIEDDIKTWGEVIAKIKK
jgi:tripartite-type tricarboxylate transporter receptor subunit TctC